MSGAHTPGSIGYASAEHLSRRTEYERNGTVIYPSPIGSCTTPLFAGPQYEAADELLEVLTAVMLGLNVGFVSNEVGDAARAAIAKARGEA